MKNIVLSLTFLFVSNFCIAQKNLSFTIAHLAGTEPFSTESSFMNNLDHGIKPTTLKYYLSEFSLIHDGGQQTPLEDLVLLVNAEELTEVNLSDLNFEVLEALQFHIGVPEDLNHADPALQPSGHPLSYQSPSMHWGWAGGYKFLVTEGVSGTTANSFQIHSTGDNLYTTVNVDLNISAAAASEVSFVINADYVQLFKDIPMANGVFNHGDSAEAADAVNNLATEVYSVSDIVLNTANPVFKGSYTFAPNPSTNGMINLQADLVEFDNYTLSVRNMLGQEIQSYNFDGDKVDYTISNLSKGIFFVKVSNEDGLGFTEKIIVQ